MADLIINPKTIIVKTQAEWAIDSFVYSERQMLITSDLPYDNSTFPKFKIGNGTDPYYTLQYAPVHLFTAILNYCYNYPFT